MMYEVTTKYYPLSLVEARVQAVQNELKSAIAEFLGDLNQADMNLFFQYSFERLQKNLKEPRKKMDICCSMFASEEGISFQEKRETLKMTKNGCSMTGPKDSPTFIREAAECFFNRDIKPEHVNLFCALMGIRRQFNILTEDFPDYVIDHRFPLKVAAQRDLMLGQLDAIHKINVPNVDKEITRLDTHGPKLGIPSRRKSAHALVEEMCH